MLHRYGWGGYFSTQFWVDPRNDMTGVLMTQVLPTYSSGADKVFLSIVSSAIEQ